MNIKTDKSFIYDYENLDPSSEEFTFLKKTFVATSFDYIEYVKFNGFHVYKVNERNHVNTAVKKSNNLMLYHGTSQKGVTGILKEGFRNSEKGWFGKGVYMTDCSKTAVDYSFRTDITSSDRYFIFVNEVLESEKLQLFTFDYDAVCDRGEVITQPKHQFEKHIYKSGPQLTENDYLVDFEGRKYVNITNEDNMVDEYIAEASVTIPRYLIVIKKK